MTFKPLMHIAVA
jgi:hypothetical protein